MKELLRKILPERLLLFYRSIKNQLRFVREDERVYFDTNTVYAGHFKVTYRGVPAIRCPFDYVMYQMIIWDVKPDLIIEIGTSNGGGALYMADILNVIGKGIVHTINIEDKAYPDVLKHPRIRTFTEGWEKYDLAETKGFSKILIIEDASHTYEDTLGSLKKFSSLVAQGSYFIVEDGIVDTLHKEGGLHGGPLRAIREFMGTTDEFIVDRTYCDLFGKNATFNVNGYLKRIK